MLPEESFRVLAFCSAVAAVYVVTAWLGLRLAMQRSWGREPVRGERNTRRAVFTLAIVGVMCAAYGRFIEPYWLDVVHVQVDSERWRGAPLRIVHFSDVHSDPSPRLEERLPAIVRAEHPDIIVFTGDAINSLAGHNVWRRCIGEIAEIAPTVVVRGNWDVWYWGRLDLFGGTRATEVANSSTTLEVRGLPVWIGGLTVDKEEGWKDLLTSAPADHFRVLLHHYPDELPRAARFGIDLYLAGHTHGGQVALPLYGALVTLSKSGKRFESGLYQVGTTWGYVNRGLGMEGGSAPRVRFFARPEVTVIDVRGMNAR